MNKPRIFQCLLLFNNNIAKCHVKPYKIPAIKHN